jgi:hypothetical protein
MCIHGITLFMSMCIHSLEERITIGVHVYEPPPLILYVYFKIKMYFYIFCLRALRGDVLVDVDWMSREGYNTTPLYLNSYPLSLTP